MKKEVSEANPIKEYATNIGVVGIANLLVRLSSLILLPILTKVSGTHDYGIWTQVNVTVSLLTPLALLGLLFSMIRFLAAEKDKRKLQEGFYSMMFFALFVSLFISLLLFTLSGFIADKLFDREVKVVKITAILIPLECLNAICMNYFRTFRMMKKYSAFVVSRSYGNVGLVSFMILQGFGIFWAVVALLIVDIIIFFIAFSMILLEIGFSLPSFSNIREYLRYGLPTLPRDVSSWVMGLSDRYIIAYFLGVTYVGVYSPGYALGNIIALSRAPLGTIMLPTFSKLYDENRMEELEVHLKYTLKYFLLMAIPSVFGLSLLSKQLLVIMSTPEIASQGYLVTPFIALSNLLYGIHGIYAQILYLERRTKIIGGLWTCSALMNLGLNIVFVPKFGILGASITTLVAYMTATTITVYFSSKHFSLCVDNKSALKSLLASAVIPIVIIKMTPKGLLDTLFAIVLCSFIYFAVQIMLKGITIKEIKFFLSLILIRL